MTAIQPTRFPYNLGVTERAADYEQVGIDMAGQLDQTIAEWEIRHNLLTARVNLHTTPHRRAMVPHDRDAFHTTNRWTDYLIFRNLWHSSWWPAPPRAVDRVLPTGPEVVL